MSKPLSDANRDANSVINSGAGESGAIVPEDGLSAEDRQRTLLEEYDNESRYRVFAGKALGLFVRVFAIAVALYHLYGAVLGTPVTQIGRASCREIVNI